MARVAVAQPGDIPAWLSLAAEVEPLFGPLVNEPSFRRALYKNVARGSAYCVREGDGPAGVPLCGGLLWSAHAPLYTIGWLAVAKPHRRQGVGLRLVEHVLRLVETPAEVMVTTFGANDPAGETARGFYERLGFQAAEAAPNGPDGGSRQVFRLYLR